MADVIHRTTLQFIASANTVNHPEPTWKHNPDMSLVAGVAQIYWKWDAVNERPEPMTGPEQAAVDQAILDAARDGVVAEMDNFEGLIRQLTVVLVNELNEDATAINDLVAGLSTATNISQVRDAALAIANIPARAVSNFRARIRSGMGT